MAKKKLSRSDVARPHIRTIFFSYDEARSTFDPQRILKQNQKPTWIELKLNRKCESKVYSHSSWGSRSEKETLGSRNRRTHPGKKELGSEKNVSKEQQRTSTSLSAHRPCRPRLWLFCLIDILVAGQNSRKNIPTNCLALQLKFFLLFDLTRLSRRNFSLHNGSALWKLFPRNAPPARRLQFPTRKPEKRFYFHQKFSAVFFCLCCWLLHISLILLIPLIHTNFIATLELWLMLSRHVRGWAILSRILSFLGFQALFRFTKKTSLWHTSNAAFIWERTWTLLARRDHHVSSSIARKPQKKTLRHEKEKNTKHVECWQTREDDEQARVDGKWMAKKWISEITRFTRNLQL